MTSCAPRALSDALKREQRQNHAENITCYCPEVAKPPAGRLGRARGCRGRSGKSLTCPAGSCAQKWACQRSERAPGHAPGATLVHFDVLEPGGAPPRHRATAPPCVCSHATRFSNIRTYHAVPSPPFVLRPPSPSQSSVLRHPSLCFIRCCRSILDTAN